MSLDRKINRIQFLSGNSLKVIAVLTMLIDHLCKIVLQWLLSNYWGAMADNGQMSWERFREIDYFIRFDLQSIGTIAFPLFCFCWQKDSNTQEVKTLYWVDACICPYFGSSI